MLLRLIFGLSLVIGFARGYWSVESQPDRDYSYFCQGANQAISGFIFRSVSESSSSSSGGGSRGVTDFRQAKRYSCRVYCGALDGSANITSKNSISTSSSTSSKLRSKAEDRKEFSLSEGCDLEDKDKNCQDGSYACGFKSTGGGQRMKFTCCKSDGYEPDSNTGCRVVGPFKFVGTDPVQVMNPQQSNTLGCGADVVQAFGLSADGVSIKICTWKKKGAQQDSACKEKKETVIKEYMKKSSQSSSSSGSSSSSTSESSSSNGKSSSSSSTNDQSNSGSQNNNGQGQQSQSQSNSQSQSAAENGQTVGQNAANNGQSAGQDAAKGGKSAGHEGANLGQNAAQNAAGDGQSVGQNVANGAPNDVGNAGSSKAYSESRKASSSANSRTSSETHSSNSGSSNSKSYSSSSSSSTGTSSTYTEERVSSFQTFSESVKTVAGKSFSVTCPPNYAISRFTTYAEKTSSGKWDIVYQFFYKKVVTKSFAHVHTKKRYTKFIQSSQTSQIACKDEESLCGVLSDYDGSGDRLYSFQCCDYSDAQSDAGKTEEKTETVNLQQGSVHECKGSKRTQVIKSMKIVSASQTSVTYSVTYCTYKSTKSRFAETTTTKEYSGKTVASSGSKEKGRKRGKKLNSNGSKTKKGKKASSGNKSGKKNTRKGSGQKKGSHGH